jgi:hypothetical protein
VPSVLDAPSRRLSETVAIGAGHVFRTGPEQFWTSDLPGMAMPGSAAPGHPAAVGAVALSHSRTRVVIEGLAPAPSCGRIARFDPDVFASTRRP